MMIIINDLKIPKKQFRNLELFTYKTHLKQFINFFNEPIRVTAEKSGSNAHYVIIVINK